MAVQFRPTSDYSTQQLVEIYNKTRSDYLVPMPMVLDEFIEYLHVYDITLNGSVVALQDGQPVGLNLLGLRGDQGWVTRLGVVHTARRLGVASGLMETLLEAARRRGVNKMWLEVITDNQPGRNLFQSFGFTPGGEMIVAERQSAEPTTIPTYRAVVEPASRVEILEELAKRRGHIDWKNHLASLSKLDGLVGLRVMADSGSAWVAFRPRPDRVEKTILGGVSSQPKEIVWVALHHLYQGRAGFTFEAENVPAQALSWDAYQRAGFRVRFRRVEMSLLL